MVLKCSQFSARLLAEGCSGRTPRGFSAPPFRPLAFILWRSSSPSKESFVTEVTGRCVAAARVGFALQSPDTNRQLLAPRAPHRSGSLLYWGFLGWFCSDCGLHGIPHMKWRAGNSSAAAALLSSMNRSRAVRSAGSRELQVVGDAVLTRRKVLESSFPSFFWAL